MLRLKSSTKDNFKVPRMVKYVFERVENIVGIEKFWLPAFSSIPPMFSKGFFFSIAKTWHCVENSKMNYFKNIVEKKREYRLTTNNFLRFNNTFCRFKFNSVPLASFFLSSANSFRLEKSKILSSVKKFNNFL